MKNFIITFSYCSFEITIIKSTSHAPYTIIFPPLHPINHARPPPLQINGTRHHFGSTNFFALIVRNVCRQTCICITTIYNFIIHKIEIRIINHI